MLLVGPPSESPSASSVGGLLEGVPAGVSVADGVEGSPPLEPSTGLLVGVLGLSDGVDSPVGDAAGELGQVVGDDEVEGV